jgi:hypothetical protein
MSRFAVSLGHVNAHRSRFNAHTFRFRPGARRRACFVASSDVRANGASSHGPVQVQQPDRCRIPAPQSRLRVNTQFRLVDVRRVDGSTLASVDASSKEPAVMASTVGSPRRHVAARQHDRVPHLRPRGEGSRSRSVTTLTPQPRRRPGTSLERRDHPELQPSDDDAEGTMNATSLRSRRSGPASSGPRPPACPASRGLRIARSARAHPGPAQDPRPRILPAPYVSCPAVEMALELRA